MHIVFLTTEFPGITDQNGGIGEYTHKTAKKLVTYGHKVTVVVAGPGNFVKNINNVEIISFKALDYWGGIDGGVVDQAFRVLKMLINSYKFQKTVRDLSRISHIDVLQSPNYLFPTVFFDNKSFPVICRVSSYSPLLRNAYGKKRTFINGLEDLLEVLSVKKTFRVFSPSKFMADIYSRLLHKDKVPVIRTIIGEIVPKFEPNPRGEKAKSPRKYKLITYFGSLSKVKGVDLIADVLPDILRNQNVKFLFIGKDYGIPGYGSVSEYIRSKSGSCSTSVIIKEQMGKNELWKYVRDSYCCLFPSRIDNLPNACLEAISLGIPVIGSTNSSLDEMIDDGKTGFLFENSNSEDLYLKIVQMLELSSEEYKEMRVNVKILYKEFLNENRLQDLINFYEKTINEYRKYK